LCAHKLTRRFAINHDTSIVLTNEQSAVTPVPAGTEFNFSAHAEKRQLHGDHYIVRRPSSGAMSGFEPLGGSPEEFALLIARGMVTWAAAAEAAGLRK
jgi:hypothetical protein